MWMFVVALVASAPDSAFFLPDADPVAGPAVEWAQARPPAKRPPRSVPAKPSPLAPSTRSTLTPGVAAAGAAGGALVGGVIGSAGMVATGVVALGVVGGQQSETAVIALSIVAVVLAVATPFLSAFGAGAVLLWLNPATRPDEWTGLLGCAAQGYCAGLSLVLGSVLGVGGCSPGFGRVPPADRPAEWTAGGTIAGIVGGALVGVIGGYLLAPDRSQPQLFLLAGGGIGAVGGAVIGAATTAAITTAIGRR
jgi:hypothetical protein